jgi:hypothetical protein
MLKLFMRFIAPNNVVVYTNGYNIKDCWKVDTNQVYRLVSDLGITIKNGFSKDKRKEVFNQLVQSAFESSVLYIRS